MRKTIGMVVGAVGLMMVSMAAIAATGYVSDELSVNMRRGPGTDYRIIQLVDAGDQVETLGETSGWTEVRTADGETGYVLTRFLSDQPAARTRIVSMESQVAELQSENSALRAELAEVLDGSSELGELKRDLVAENEQLTSELTQVRRVSSNAIRISEENQAFREQLLSMRSEVERLRHENESLQSRREGMKIGALILIGGIVVGLLLPMFRRRGKSSWDSL